MAKERVVLTDPAKADADAIVHYLQEQWSPERAIRFVDELYEKLDLIEFMPGIGRPSATSQTVRRVLLGNYHALYYEDIGEVILVLRIIDTRSNPTNNPFDQ
jgi:plasmid stabilization system protein ParE